jgi:glutaredoxin
MKYKKHEKPAGTSAPKSLFGEPVTVALGLIVVLLLAYIVYNSWNTVPPSGGNNATVNQTQTPKKANVTIELFVMSQCPYGVQAEVTVKKVIDKFGGDVNLSLHFIANKNTDGTFSSLHGANEVSEDLRQVCIMKYYPKSLLDYLSCVSKDYVNAGNIWSNCTSQSNMDADKIRNCSTGDEALGLLSDNIKKSNELKVDSSPTIYLNGKQYAGAASESSLTKSICVLMPGSNTCKNLPPEVAVELIVVNDDSCVLCDPSGIVGTLRDRFEISNMSVRDVDYSSTEGKALLQKFNLTGVPAYIFNASITMHGSYSSLSRYLLNVSSSYMLLVQPVKLLNMSEKNDTIQLFVMSQCPYGVMAEKAVKELLDAIPDLKFSGLHFIATESGNGTFTSLHGQGEVEEDLRQVCVVKYNSDKLFDYVLCIDANPTNSGSIWEKCANDSKIDVGKIRSCYTGDEGKALLRENIKSSNSMGIYSSPTLLLNNNTIFNAVYAEQMRQVVCAYNPALKGCNKTLSGTGTSTPSAGCG